MRKLVRNILLLLALVCAIIAVVLFVKEQKAGGGYDLLRNAVKKTADAGSEVSETESERAVPETAAEEVTEADAEDQVIAETEMVSEEKMSEEEETDSVNLLADDTEDEMSYSDRVEVSFSENLQIPVDFEELQDINSDIYAWIEVDGTLVDYPVVQSPDDNTFYLDHSFDKKKAFEGTIFSEDYNSLTFDDPHTVLYGHNMKNESMFGSLHRYMDRSFFNDHREVTVYLPGEIRKYEIFAAYFYDSRHLLLSFDCFRERVFEYYLNQVFSIRGMDSFVDASYELNSKDKIITLSTCYQGRSDTRYLVQAVLVSVEKRSDSVE